MFLHEAEVPPTKNHAEQMLRPAVITRKVGGCNKNLLGALVHGVLASLMVSCKRQGKRFLDLARRLWQSGDPPAIDLGALQAAEPDVPEVPASLKARNTRGSTSAQGMSGTHSTSD